MRENNSMLNFDPISHQPIKVQTEAEQSESDVYYLTQAKTDPLLTEK